jgi:hypothetical protein
VANAMAAVVDAMMRANDFMTDRLGSDGMLFNPFG